jgi:hypothetical protein
LKLLGPSGSGGFTVFPGVVEPHQGGDPVHCRRRVSIIVVWVLAAELLAAAPPNASASVGPLAGSSCSGRWHIQKSPNPGRWGSILYAVSAAAPDDAWAVGFRRSRFGDEPVIEHWDGTSWRVVPSGAELSRLQAVDVISGTDAWAVGEGQGGTLTLHWDGSTWTRVDSPGAGDLLGVSAVSSTDVWAVGVAFDGTALTLHWDGSTWSIVPSPNHQKGHVHYLTAVSALSSSDVWAVGYSQSESRARRSTLSMHWDGTAWSRVDTVDTSDSGNVLKGVVALAPDDVWAVGLHGRRGLLFKDKTLVEHWDGAAWNLVSAPNPSRSFNALEAVSASSPTNVWAVGAFSPKTRDQATLIEHFDGKEWAKFPSESPAGGNWLVGVSTLPTGESWAVGWVYPTVAETLVEHLCSSA